MTIEAANEAAGARIAVTVNGEAQDVPHGCTVATLLELRGVETAMVAVERNGAIVRRAQHGAVHLEAGDRLEIVGFVGGG